MVGHSLGSIPQRYHHRADQTVLLESGKIADVQQLYRLKPDLFGRLAERLQLDVAVAPFADRVVDAPLEGPPARRRGGSQSMLQGRRCGRDHGAGGDTTQGGTTRNKCAHIWNGIDVGRQYTLGAATRQGL